MNDALKEYGYLWDGMMEISKEVAEILFLSKEVFLLYPDDTEAAAESIEDINRHSKYGGLFGIELERSDADE